MKTCLVKIPANNSNTIRDFEGLLIQIHEILAQQLVSFELYGTGQNTLFCYTANESCSQIIAGQIYAYFPEADILEIDDYLQRITPDNNYLTCEYSLARSDIYPLNDYSKIESNSNSNLLSVASQCAPGQAVLIQLVLQPQPDTFAHQFFLNLRSKLNRLVHSLRPKYWIKRSVNQEIFEGILNKCKSRLFRVNIRALVFDSNTDKDLVQKIEAISGAMRGFNSLDLNQIRIGSYKRSKFALRNFQNRELSAGFHLSTHELATIYHIPSDKEVPNLVRVLSRRHAPPPVLPVNRADDRVSFFASTNFRNQNVPFGIRLEDRRRHLYVLGKSGSGKSKLLELLVAEDLKEGRGVAVLDPHGDLVDNILARVPKNRISDVVLFDPSDVEFPIAFNPLEQVPESQRVRVTIGFIEIFKKLFGSNWTPRIEHVLRYTTLALLDTPDTTVLSILKMLSDKNYRQYIVKNIQEGVVKSFWVNEFAAWSEKFDNEAITPLLNKVGQFVSTSMIHNIVAQPKNLLDFRQIIDNRKILLMKVSKGMLGEENAALLGAMVVTKIYQAAMSRADVRESERTDFYFYVDEFHNFATDTFDEILSEARKYRLNLTIANQFLGQLSENIRKTVFGNVGSLISFRVGGEDAATLANEFRPRFTEQDLINLAVRDLVIKMSIQGELQEAFSARSLDLEPVKQSYANECRQFSRAHYARNIRQVKEMLLAWEAQHGSLSGGNPIRSTLPHAIQKPVDKYEEPLL